MKVGPVVKAKTVVQFNAKTDIEKKDTKENKIEKQYSKKQLNGYVIATALSAAILAGGLVYGRNRLKTGNLKAKISELKASENKLGKELEQETQRTKTILTDIFEGDLAPKDVREKIFNTLKTKIYNSDYGYDIKNPPVLGKDKIKNSNAIPLPEFVETSNRADMVELQIPEIAQDGRFSFELPMSNEVKITRDSMDFNPVKNKESIISLDYGKSVQWDNDKVARDILQNFYDGHGQTLNGVKMTFIPVYNGRYNIKIEGKSTYTPEKAVYLGLSSKQFNDRAAGNYGEGLKMASLKLLTDGGAKEVKIASNNWICNWTIGKNELLKDEDARVMYYSIDKLSENIDGNYLEFETDNFGLLQSLRKTINRFYHSGNIHFKCPDFENEIIAIKNLQREQKGGIYIAGQRFQFDGNYDGLDNIIISIKEKIPKNIFDTSRDRTSVNKADLEKIGKWLATDKRMSNEEKVKLLKSLENYWDCEGIKKEHPVDELVKGFLHYSNWFSPNEPLYVDFPDDKYVAYSYASSELVMDLINRGYRVCHEGFGNIGMQTIRELLEGGRKHDVIVPNDIQKKKILILREALQKLSGSLQHEHFTGDELDAHIYMFDRNSPGEKHLYSDCNAEAIIDKGVSKGFWIDKDYLDRGKFNEILETALHELSHKAGGDESSEFSYKLTNVNKSVIGQILNDIPVRNELQALNAIWNSLC